MSLGIPVKIGDQPILVTSNVREAIRSTYHYNFPSKTISIKVPANERWYLESLFAVVVTSAVNPNVDRYLDFWHVRDGAIIDKHIVPLRYSSTCYIQFSPLVPHFDYMYGASTDREASRCVLPDCMPGDTISLYSTLNAADTISADIFYRVISDG